MDFNEWWTKYGLGMTNRSDERTIAEAAWDYANAKGYSEGTSEGYNDGYYDGCYSERVGE